MQEIRVRNYLAKLIKIYGILYKGFYVEEAVHSTFSNGRIEPASDLRLDHLQSILDFKCRIFFTFFVDTFLKTCYCKK